MNALLLAVALAGINSNHYSLTDGATPRRVHVLVDADTRDIELMRVSSVRAGYYRGYVAMAVEADRVCRGHCDLDVDVDPRVDYVLRVGDEEPRAVDLTAHGDSVIVKVTPPSGGMRAGGTVMLIGGIVTTVAGGLGVLAGLGASGLSLLGSSSSSYSYGRSTILGIDPGVVIAMGIGAVAVGVANIIIGAIMKRRAAMEVDTMRGDVLPGNAPMPPPAPSSGAAVM